MIKITLKERKRPVKLTLEKKQKPFELKAVYYILIDEVKGVANIYNTYTHCHHKFIDRGFYRIDKKMIERLKENGRIKWEAIED